MWEQIGQAAVGLGILIGGGWGGWQSYRSRQIAEQARDYAEPTGNGFAGDLRAFMARTDASLVEVRRDVGGIRSELREERTERREADADLRRRLDERAQRG